MEDNVRERAYHQQRPTEVEGDGGDHRGHRQGRQHRHQQVHGRGALREEGALSLDVIQINMRKSMLAHVEFNKNFNTYHVRDRGGVHKK